MAVKCLRGHGNSPSTEAMRQAPLYLSLLDEEKSSRHLTSRRLQRDRAVIIQLNERRNMAMTNAISAARTFQTVTPETGQDGRVYQGHGVEQAASIAADVHQAQIAWRRTPFSVCSPL